MFLKGLSGVPQVVFGSLDSVACGNTLDGLNRYTGLLDGPGQFPGSSFNARLQFRTGLAGHIGSTLSVDTHLVNPCLLHPSM